MEQHRDEHIVCNDCGTSFLFSAGEAAVFTERGLAAPKRCKECRRARKTSPVNATSAGRARSAPGAFNADRREMHQAYRSRAPRYTGDVNEYRSPMQDPSYMPSASPWNSIGYTPRSSRQAPAWEHAGPAAARPLSAQRRKPGPFAERFSPAMARPNHDENRRGLSTDVATKRKLQAEMFSITCNACGNSAEVPFRPAEGRDVFCQACYRARKPA